MLTLFDLFEFVTVKRERESEIKRELYILVAELNNEVLFFFLYNIKHYSWLKEI